jgi:hypothetical protein
MIMIRSKEAGKSLGLLRVAMKMIMMKKATRKVWTNKMGKIMQLTASKLKLVILTMKNTMIILI